MTAELKALILFYLILAVVFAIIVSSVWFLPILSMQDRAYFASFGYFAILAILPTAFLIHLFRIAR